MFTNFENMQNTHKVVRFFYHEVNFHFPDRKALKTFIVELFKLEKRDIDNLSFIFCNDEYLLHINKTFLSHDYYTDIVTFDLSASNLITGEIYISVDRVKDNATALETTFIHELHRVIFHGALHLCGYQDKSKKQQQTMRAKEDYYLSLYFS